MMGMRSPPAGGEHHKRMSHPRVDIKTGTPIARCAVAVGGHRLLTPHGNVNEFQATRQYFRWSKSLFPYMRGVEPLETAKEASAAVFFPYAWVLALLRVFMMKPFSTSFYMWGWGGC